MKSQKTKNKMIYFLMVFLIWMVTIPCPLPVEAATLNLRIGNMGFAKKVKSMKDLKYQKMVKQTTDYSCGAAALATILTYYFGRETSEEEVLGTILKHADEETAARIMDEGVTMLDLKMFSDSVGYEGAGFQISLEDLKNMDRPGIALIDQKGYQHFVVLKGVTEDRVYLADPSKGNIVKGLDEFKKMWNGIILVFKNSGPKIQTHALEVEPGTTKDRVGLLQKLNDFGFASTPSEF